MSAFTACRQHAYIHFILHPGRWIPPLLLLLRVSSIFFPPVKRVLLGEFFLICVEGLRTECVLCCTDFEAPWGKFVILGYINKIDLTYLHLLGTGSCPFIPHNAWYPASISKYILKYTVCWINCNILHAALFLHRNSFSHVHFLN